jgi:hypothetical protein|tara:strand:+ start:1546 stop:1839 length:294 start_codon:yes stop_codon:yes gene_type:complete
MNNELEINMHQAMIKRSIRDLVNRHEKRKQLAIAYFNRDLFIEHCAKANYPSELRDSLFDLMLLSHVQQKRMAKEIISYLDCFKIPPPSGELKERER